MKPYEFYLNKFNEKIKRLKDFVSTINSVDDLEDEGDKATFIEIFRDLIRIKTKLSVFTNFKSEDLDIDEYEYTGYQSKYIDMYNEIKKPSSGKEKNFCFG